MITYFPNLIFGWTYFVLLFAMLCVASYLDVRTMKVPKWLTMSLLGGGLLVNLIRGAWLGAIGLQTWVLPASGLAVGLADGLLFTLAGFVVGFCLFFFLWVIGVSGGGDVKLFTAVGAWIGPLLALEVFMATVVVVGFIVFFRMALYLLSGKGFQVMRKQASGKTKADKKRKVGDLGFSLPLAIASLIVLLWAFRAELQLSPPVPSADDGLNDARVELTDK